MGDLRTYRINVQARHTTKQSSWVTTAHQLQIDSLTGCVSARVFFVRGILSETDIEQLAQELLADPVSEVFTVGEPDTADADHTIDVTLQAGVTDPVAQNLIRAARNLNIDLENAASGQFFQLYGELSDADLETLATTVLSNPVIQRHSINSLLDAPFVAPHESDGLVETIPIRNAGDNQLIDISKERRLSLN
ncbi:MAG: phosphoribosylformylglycinamidine synthase subunit PurS, partial [Chloroflexota bacterium]